MKNRIARFDSPVQQLNGSQPSIELPYECRMIIEGRDGWSVIFPYLCYMPEKNRLLLLITRLEFERDGDASPAVGNVSPQEAGRPMLMYSDDHGDTWSEPRPMYSGSDELQGDAISLSYLGDGKVMMLNGEGARAWWISRDYGQKWERLSAASRPEMWDPLFVDVEPSTGQVKRLVEPSYIMVRPWHHDLMPDPLGPFSQACLRFSPDEGRSWGEEIKVPQWLGVNEVTLARAANGDLVAACRTDMPKRFERMIDDYSGLGISISKDDGHTWSDLNMLFDWGRHHPSIVRLSTGELVMSYLVRRGYPDTADERFPQFGEEAVVSFDNGQTWDLDHRYILYKYQGSISRRDVSAWESAPQNTSSALLPNGEIVTVFGIGPRVGLAEEAHPYYPRDVGLVRWRVNHRGLNNERTISDAPYDSDPRNKLDINPPSRPTPGRTNIAMARFGAEITASKCLGGPEFMLYDPNLQQSVVGGWQKLGPEFVLYDPYVLAIRLGFFTSPAWVEVRWPDIHKLDEIAIEGRGLGSLQPPGAENIRDGYKLQLDENGEWRDFTNFSQVTKTAGRNDEFGYVHKFKPVLAKGIRLQMSFPEITPEKRPYITHLDVMGWR